MKRLAGALVVLTLIGGAVWVGIFSRAPRSDEIAQTGASPSPSEPPHTVPVASCNDVRIPRNVERDTNLDREAGLLTVSYTPPGTGANRSVTVAYRRGNCSWSQNRSIRRVIVHALTAALEDKSRGSFVVAKCFDPVRRPRHMVLACADFGFRANRIEWASWTRSRAEGRADFVMRDFTAPDFGVDRRDGRISLFGRRYCIRLERFTFWKGRVVSTPPARAGKASTSVRCAVSRRAKWSPATRCERTRKAPDEASVRLSQEQLSAKGTPTPLSGKRASTGSSVEYHMLPYAQWPELRPSSS